MILTLPETAKMRSVNIGDDIGLRRGGIADMGPAVSVAVAAGLWDPSDHGPVQALLASAIAIDAGPVWLVAGKSGTVNGTACAQVVAGTDRTWDLTMIGVEPRLHRRGIGSALLRAIEGAIREAGGRMLKIETSSSPAQDQARAFYKARGYDEECRIRDYWEDGDDLVLFWKRLV